jgi:hypothetical protein
MLAIRLMQQQQIDVQALNIQTVFACCRDSAGRAARQLGVPLTFMTVGDDYLDLVRRPRFGRGRGANPCVDCRIDMFRRARQFMAELGAQFVVSGEVLGQRPMSQKRRDLDVIARHSGLEDRLLRPLSAQLLPATRAEREGLVDRAQLLDLSGRSRKAIFALGRQFGFPDGPGPSTGCALTEIGFSRKVFDLLQWDPDARRWDFELLRVGRHFRLDHRTKIIVGRSAEENDHLQSLFHLPEAKGSTLLEPEAFPGPAVLIVGSSSGRSRDEAVALMLRHTRHVAPERGGIRATHRGRVRTIPVPAELGPTTTINVTDAPAGSRGGVCEGPSQAVRA